ncbi:MAG: molybdopterin/thiamine biosynthesis adenylyltransferase [Enterobacterales bacterium]|jgi:molybdopterin/thiamine biosynthesis adenylyltransferase
MEKIMDDEQLLRYSRHILLPQVDFEGQEKLQDSKVLIVGLGGLGSPVALYLAAAGVGQLLVCDFDKVELSNLQRQIIHGVDSIGQYKVDSAIERLKKLNPDCKIRGINEAITEEKLEELLIHDDKTIDLIVDCTDNLNTRLIINKACVKHKVKLLSGAAIRMEGQISVFLNEGSGPCYQCLFSNTEDDELSCSEAGVLATTVGVIGTLQAQEALKILMGIGKIQDGSLLLMDGMNGDWQKLIITKKDDCLIC